jgi:methylenetetrahydrofolate reductase (NADPH)
VARIDELLAAGPTFSFEFFPPKTPAARLTLARTLRDLEPLEPSFVSVTYGAGGSTREWTHDLVAGMLHTTTLNPMAHLTCVGHSRLDLAEILVRYRRAGVDNVLCLGGDPPAGMELPPSELDYAIELVELAQAVGGFAVGVAAHPAGHPRSSDAASDRRFLAAKLEVADFAITQFFFQSEEYLRLMDDLAQRGLDKPVIPGIMPVTSLSAIPRRAVMGAAVPADMAEALEAAGDPESVRQMGIEMATELCQELLDQGAPGLHFYTLNRSMATRHIYANLGLAAPAAR